MVEHHVRNVGVGSSNLLRSIRRPWCGAPHGEPLWATNDPEEAMADEGHLLEKVLFLREPFCAAKWLGIHTYLNVLTNPSMQVLPIT